MNQWKKLQKNTAQFSKKLTGALTQLGIYETCQRLEIDHICVRLAKSTNADLLREQMTMSGEEVSVANVNSREIVIFQMATPLLISGWHTHGVEVPYPKSNHSYEDGWEHVEFVLSDAENTMGGVRESFFNTFPNLDVKVLKEKYQYSENEPHAGNDQLPNPTIGIKVNDIGIKFHALSIQKVVGFTH